MRRCILGFSIIFTFFGCFPNLDRDPLEIVNLYSFLNREPPPPRFISVNIHSKAYGSLILQNLTDAPIEITENGIQEIPVRQRSGGNYELNIVTQPQDHSCRIINSIVAVDEPEEVEVNCFSVLETIPPTGGILPPDGTITIRLSAPIVPDLEIHFTEVTLDTDPSDEIEFDFIDTLFENDTFTATPQSPALWITGAGKRIGYNFLSEEGKRLATGEGVLEFIIANPDDIYYVSTSGNDANDGKSPANSLRNINTAILEIGTCASLGCAVLVEEGAYEANISGDKIELRNGISLVGSYVSGSNFSTRTPSSKSSVIRFSDPAPTPLCGPTSNENCSPILINNTATQERTTIDGFRIESAPSKYSRGLEANGGFTLLNSDVIAGSANGTATPTNSIGLTVADSNFKMENVNVLGGGNVDDFVTRNTIGVETSNLSGSPLDVFWRNVSIQSGSCNTGIGKAVGFLTRGFAGVVLNNNSENIIIEAGDCSSPPNNNSFGIEVSEGDLRISNANILSGNAGRNSYGIANINDDSIIEIGLSGAVSIETGDANIGVAGIYKEVAGSLIVRNTNIVTGNHLGTTGGGNYGIQHQISSTIQVENTEIRMGNTNDRVSYGIFTVSEDNASFIRRSSIQRGHTEGANGFNAGIVWQGGGSEGTIANNIIFGGSSQSIINAINITETSPGQKIFHNTLISGVGNIQDSAIIYHTDGLGNMSIKNNIFISQNSAPPCMFIEGTPSEGIQGNVFWGCSTFFDDSGATFYNTIYPNGSLGTGAGCNPGEILQEGNDEFEKNANLNPSLASPFSAPFDFGFTATTSCGIRRLLNIIPGIQDDRFRGADHPSFPVRPSAPAPITVSVGAIEDPGTCP